MRWRNVETDASFIKMGGMDNWGCFAFFLIVIVFILLFTLGRVLLIPLVGESMAWWGSLIFFIGLAAGIVALWIRRRQRRKREQEQAWQQAIGDGSQKRGPSQEFTNP